MDSRFRGNDKSKTKNPAKADSFVSISNQDSLKLRTISFKSGRLPYISR